MVPVGTARERLAVGKGLLYGLRVRLGAPEDLPLLRRRVREVLELDELRGLGNARLRDRKEVAAPLESYHSDRDIGVTGIFQRSQVTISTL